MAMCVCGKAGFTSAGQAYEAIAKTQKRQKSSFRGKGRMTRATNQKVDRVRVQAYRCTESGLYHMGHGNQH